MAKNDNMLRIAIDLYDFEPVADAFRDQTVTWSVDIGDPQEGPLAPLLQQVFGKSTEEDCISSFCREVNALMSVASPTAIYQVNSTDEQENPVLFSAKTGGWAVKGYAGVLQFDLIPEPGNSVKHPARITLRIHSRFDKGNNKGLFLMYMFEKGAVARGRLYENMDIIGSQINCWDLMLAVTFTEQLHEAMKKGLFRQYRDYARNDARLRGKIDIARHLRENPVFNGKVSYTAREYTVDNPINILILRAYHHLKSKYPFLLRSLIGSSEVVKQGIRTLEAEVENWQIGTDHAVLLRTKRKVANAVYRAYEPLRKTAHAILTKMGVNVFSQSGGEPVSGLLINLPALWEEFLYYTAIRDYADLSGPYAQESFRVIGVRDVRPDFLIPTLLDENPDIDEPEQLYDMVLDAKYKAAWGQTCLSGTDDDTKKLRNTAWLKVRNDVFQILAYALAFDCRYCGVIFPISAKDFPYQKIKPVSVSDFCPDRFFARIPYVIPDVTDQNFRSEFAKADRKLTRFLNQLRKTTTDQFDAQTELSEMILTTSELDDD